MIVIYLKTTRHGTGRKKRLREESGKYLREEGPNVILERNGREYKILKERVKEYIF